MFSNPLTFGGKLLRFRHIAEKCTLRIIKFLKKINALYGFFIIIYVIPQFL